MTENKENQPAHNHRWGVFVVFLFLGGPGPIELIFSPARYSYTTSLHDDDGGCSRIIVLSGNLLS